jgi:SAM-dependent methyltransferase
MQSGEARGYFEFLAKLGLTKHLGSMEATRKLIALCHIDGDRHVLDVGCGVGATPCYLAKKVGCRVTGVDLLEKMIAQSRERARGEGVEGRTAFAVADARRLPFEDGHFDAVVAESVNVFFDDKREAVREYARVTKPGGYVGITEMTWLRPVAPEVKAYYKRVVHADALEAQGWLALLKEAGLQDVVGDAHQVEIPREGKGRFERYGCRGITKVLLKTLTVFFKDRASREFLKDVTGSLPKDLLGDMGYGVYAGQKG